MPRNWRTCVALRPLFQREEEIRQSATLGALYYSEASKTENVNKYISFAYDNAGRRASLTVPGQSVVNYTFNNANRMTQIAQGTATVGFTYDNANRRATLTLPNGVVTSYNYDTASQLTGITYTLGSNPLGTLSYAYDNDGRRSSVTGSFARTGLPLAMSQTAYNANNQLTTWGTANLFYDLNGNMTSDGTHSYTWDARNRLTQIDSGNTANFAYDPFGRRTSKTILSAQTGFLYDGANAVQELSGTTVTANSLSGGIDEVFQRTDSAGARSFLTDALGSTTALVDSTGTVQTSYTFEPFGNTATTGSGTTNSFAYTGRELDAGNLYYYRARYYSPALQRFISEDPIGFSGGDFNLYGYVGNSPTNGNDPLGLWSPGGHDELIRHALAPCGVSPEQIHEIQQGSRALDATTGTSPEGANFHSMAQPGQSVDDAVNARNNFVANTLQIAQFSSASNPAFAMNQLGVAMHPMMDFTSPAHTMPNGDPIGWCGVTGCPGNRGNVLLHSPNDTLGIERVQDITPEIFNLNDQAIRDAYSFVTGKSLACRK